MNNITKNNITTTTATTKASDPALKDDNALLGVALGAAPLVAVPVLGLSALRSALSATQARRAQIEQEIEKAELAKIKRKKDAAADISAAVPALVCFCLFLFKYLNI